MSDAAVLAAPVSSPARWWRSPAGLILVCALALGLASGRAAGSGSKAAVVLPVAAGVGLALCVLAVRRFSTFVMVMLVLRSGVDLAKLSGSTTGTTQAAGNRALDPSSLFALVFLAASGLWLVRELQTKGVSLSRTDRALVVFLGAAFISVVGSTHPLSSGLEFTRMAAVVVMFVVLERLAAEPGGVRRLLLAVYASAVVPLVLTAASSLLGRGRVENKGVYTRTIGSFNDSNDFGRYLMLLIIMGVALYPHLERRGRRLLGVVVLASAAVIPLTYTRSAIVGAGLGLVVVGLFQSKRLLAGLVVVGVAAVIVVPGLAGRFSVLTDSQATSGQGNSLAWRLQYWGQVLPLANANPLSGIGLAQTQYQTDQQKQPHNDYLRAYVEMGVVGLAAYLAMLGALIALGIRAIQASARGTLERGVAVGFLGAAVAYVAVSAVANVMSNVVVLWYFFAYAAAASAIAGARRGPPRDAPALEPRPIAF